MVNATRIKIKIIYEDEGSRIRKINLPKISFRFSKRIVGLLYPIILKISNVEAKYLPIELIESAIDELSNYPPFVLVDVNIPKDHTVILIYTC